MAPPDHPYDRHVGRYGRQLAAGLIEFAAVEPGDRVLDVGCGTGQLTVALAAVVGGENVTALDPSRETVAVCSARVPAADVRLGSAENLQFPDLEFDAVLAQLVVNLVDDSPTAVAEMARVAKPGAVVAGCIWDDEKMPLLRSFWDAARTAAPAQVAEVDEGAQVGLADPGVLESWWGAAGLARVRRERFEVSANYQSFEDLWRPFESGVGHSGQLYVSLDPEQQASARADAHRRLGSPDGGFELTAQAHRVSGIRPGTNR